jgi:tartrate-resistant acid phosphatase type 5
LSLSVQPYSVRPVNGPASVRQALPSHPNAVSPLAQDSFQWATASPASTVQVQEATAATNVAIPDLRQTSAIHRFAVIGDAGVGHQSRYFHEDLDNKRHSGQDDIAEAMSRVFHDKPFASILTTGDNVYPSGQPALFEDDIRHPYKELLKKGIHFYPVLGNHDVLDPSEGVYQLRYWKTPRYYQAHLGNVDIFGIDTTLLFPNYGGDYRDDSEHARQAGIQQLKWLDQALAASNAKYKIVYGHYPLYAMNEKIEPPGMLAQLRGQLEPILQRNGVDAYLAGHHHAYERTEPAPGQTFEIVTGAAGRVLSPKEIKRVGTKPIPPVKVFIPKRHFMLFEETPEGLNFQAIDAGGKTLDQGIIHPKLRRKPQNTTALYNAQVAALSPATNDQGPRPLAVQA